MTDDCRGADSVAELNRQRERAAVVICGLNADVIGLNELENTTATDTIDDLLGAVNALCGGTNPYDFQRRRWL
jgi:predicted extracellular nuclease